MGKKEKITVNDISSFKKQRRKIAMLTAYDFAIASILDDAGIDIVLVGDSLGNVMLGYRNTLPVTMHEMITHTQAVARGVSNALVIADMPFGSFQRSENDAVSNAIDLVKAGAEGVKIEGIKEIKAIRRIIGAGIPVMGHLGFTPQSVNKLGYRIQGKTKAQSSKIKKDAKELEKAGCFAIVLELVPPEVARAVTRGVKIPVIGIGAGPYCDGQVLVTYDMLGIYKDAPRFVKKYASLGEDAKKAVLRYIKEIRS
jgi:3-methyl-2-oxobutanoate hydroxymethyltransferase